MYENPGGHPPVDTHDKNPTIYQSNDIFVLYLSIQISLVVPFPIVQDEKIWLAV